MIIKILALEHVERCPCKEALHGVRMFPKVVNIKKDLTGIKKVMRECKMFTSDCAKPGLGVTINIEGNYTEFGWSIFQSNQHSSK